MFQISHLPLNQRLVTVYPLKVLMCGSASHSSWSSAQIEAGTLTYWEQVLLSSLRGHLTIAQAASSLILGRHLSWMVPRRRLSLSQRMSCAAARTQPRHICSTTPRQPASLTFHWQSPAARSRCNQLSAPYWGAKKPGECWDPSCWPLVAMTMDGAGAHLPFHSAEPFCFSVTRSILTDTVKKPNIYISAVWYI